MRGSIGILCALAAAFAPPMEPGWAPTRSQAPVQRPRDPWVFRAELDGRAARLVAALSSELWVAYDPVSCGLGKAWSQGVRPAAEPGVRGLGARFVAAGPAYLEHHASGGAAWTLVDATGATHPAHPRWRGFRVEQGALRIAFEVALPGGGVARVEETPEFVRPEKLFEDPQSHAPWLARGLVGLRRTFRASGIPEGWRLCSPVEADCVGYLKDRLADVVDQPITLADGSPGRHFSGRIELGAAFPEDDVMLFFRPPKTAAKATK